MSPETLRTILAARAAGQSIVLATRLSDGMQYVLPGADAPSSLADSASRLGAGTEAASVEIDSEKWFLQTESPAPRLLIIGAVHIAQALAPMAAICGYAPTVIDPRRGFATVARFPGTPLVHAWPDEALATLAPDERTAIVTLTHDPKLDDPALDTALRSRNFYIGALGSRKTHASRLERLAGLGHPPEALARIRGPVGLPIGARSAPEIALSILAEMVAARHAVPLGSRE